MKFKKNLFLNCYVELIASFVLTVFYLFVKTLISLKGIGNITVALIYLFLYTLLTSLFFKYSYSSFNIILNITLFYFKQINYYLFKLYLLSQACGCFIAVIFFNYFMFSNNNNDNNSVIYDSKITVFSLFLQLFGSFLICFVYLVNYYSNKNKFCSFTMGLIYTVLFLISNTSNAEIFNPLMHVIETLCFFNINKTAFINLLLNVFGSLIGCYTYKKIFYIA